MGRHKKQLSSLDDFCYVDVYHEKGNFRTSWERVKLEDVAQFRNKYNNFNVFATVQRFSNSKRVEDEPMFAPLYFDLDSNFSFLDLFDRGEIRESDLQPYLSSEYLANLINYRLGIDLPDGFEDQLKENNQVKKLTWLMNLRIAGHDAFKLLNYFRNRFKITDADYQLFFSGSKGFHILINPYTVGIQPRADLHLVNKYLAAYLTQLLTIDTLDSSVYSKRRMLRLVNSIHHKSGKFKIPLTFDELHSYMIDLEKVEQLTELAASPREFNEEFALFEVNNDLNKWYYDEMLEEYEKTQELTSYVSYEDILKEFEEDPVCVKHVLEVGILKPNDRNKATMALASYFKDRGYSYEQTKDILIEWVKKIPDSLTSSRHNARIASTVSCIQSVYSSPLYHFGCPFILSLKSEREKIRCAGRACPLNKDYSDDDIEPEYLTLSQTADASFTEKKVAFDVLLSGKLDSPYIVPKKVEFYCNHHDICDKKDCPIKQFGGSMDREILDKSRILIELTNQSDAQQMGTLRKFSNALCNKVRYKVEDYCNVTELAVVPMADKLDNISASEYVLRRLYSTDTNVRTNNHYRLEGYVYHHPRNSTATVLVQKAIPKQDNIDQFQVTDEAKEQFKVFQPPKVGINDLEKKVELLDDHINLLLNDIEQNITFVYERRALHLATLLVYHSCLQYYFISNRTKKVLEPRGWLEMTVVGDTGQAKTQLLRNLMDYIGLGNSVSAEALKRTGFTYSMPKVGDKHILQWGDYPLADRRLLMVDEFSALDPKEFGTITEARSEGILKVSGVVKGETHARVRLILLTNPAKPRRSLSEFTYPVESLKYLLPEAADIRRFDLAMFLAEGDVSPDVLHRDHEPSEPLISQSTLRNSVLWAWSRTPDQIQILPATKKRILKHARELGKKYGVAADIPLLQSSDLDKKLARLSIALAAFLHSTDESHENIIVLPEHVEYIATWLDLIYQHPNCKFDEYNQLAVEESVLTEEEAKKIHSELMAITQNLNSDIVEEVLDFLRTHDSVRPNELADFLGSTREDVNLVVRVLTRHKMIKKSRSGMIKLPKFQKYVSATRKALI